MFGIKRMAKNILKRYHGFYVKSSVIKAKAERMISERGSVLDRIGFTEGTDKASLQEIAGGNLRLTNDYLKHYDFFISVIQGGKVFAC